MTLCPFSDSLSPRSLIFGDFCMLIHDAVGLKGVLERVHKPQDGNAVPQMGSLTFHLMVVWFFSVVFWTKTCFEHMDCRHFGAENIGLFVIAGLMATLFAFLVTLRLVRGERNDGKNLQPSVPFSRIQIRVCISFAHLENTQDSWLSRDRCALPPHLCLQCAQKEQN